MHGPTDLKDELLTQLVNIRIHPKYSLYMSRWLQLHPLSTADIYRVTYFCSKEFLSYPKLSIHLQTIRNTHVKHTLAIHSPLIAGIHNSREIMAWQRTAIVCIYYVFKYVNTPIPHILDFYFQK